MPFRIGLSGLNAAQADLKVTGNNIANTGTVGFKQSRAEFADVYATSKQGSVATAIGSGVRLAATAQQFTQGNMIFTENNLDLGITGDGFFSMRDIAGSSVYTRNGQFKVDENGYVVDNSGSKLQSYGTDANTNEINTGVITDLQVIATNIAPKFTDEASMVANIDAGEAVPTIAYTMDTNGTIDPNSYNHTTSFTSFDSLGNPMLTSVFYRKTAPGEWTVGVKQVDANGNIFQNMDPAQDSDMTVVPTPDPQIVYVGTVGTGTAPLETVTFLNNGLIDPLSVGDTFDKTGAGATNDGIGVFDFQFDLTAAAGADGASASTVANPVMVAGNGQQEIQTISVDLNKVTQYGSDFGITNLMQNGYTTGQLAGIEIDQSGIVLARFTNGESSNLGQVYLTNFTNNQGLSQLGNNYWAESFSSGQGVINMPGSGSAGLINSGAVEDSNVDLTAQLINLITAQRNFQANAKTITTANQVTQTLLQI